MSPSAIRFKTRITANAPMEARQQNFREPIPKRVDESSKHTTKENDYVRTIRIDSNQ
jgi:hypothetical protein